jgi:lysozyme
MTLDINGKNFIKGFEGLRLLAYQDSAGVWTIGWGSTRYANGAPVKQGDTLVNRECADDLFDLTLAPYEAAVNRDVKVPLTQGQFNALVDFEYNEGAGALGESTLLKKLSAGDYAGAADQFLVWDEITNPKTGKKEVLDDLFVRRKKEQSLFLGAAPSKSPPVGET